MKRLIICSLLVITNVCFSQIPLDAKIFVAGHNGLVGSAIVRALYKLNYTTIITRSSKELDLTNQEAVNKFFVEERPDYVFLVAAKVGGIKANMDYPAEFIYNNLMIEANVMHAAYKTGVKKLLFTGSSCIYPRNCPQPIREEYLLTDELEKSNEWYALAKIAGLKICQAYNKQYGTKFISCMPTNLYGPNDNFNLETSHVLPALIAKFYKAKINNDKHVIVWGTGNALREFLYVDDLANAAIFLMNNYEGDIPVNIGTGKDISIKDIAHLIKDIIDYKGDIIFDTTKSDGTPRKLLNVDYLTGLGWIASTSLEDGLRKAIDWYISNYDTLVRRK